MVTNLTSRVFTVKTGEIYYINWETGVRTVLDPRSAGTSTYSSSYYYSDEDEVSGTRSDREGCDEEEEEEDGCDETDDSDEDEAFGTGDSRNGCDEEEEEEEDSTVDDGETLIAAGCNTCFIYLMVPKGAPACLKCGGALIHLGDYL